MKAMKNRIIPVVVIIFVLVTGGFIIKNRVSNPKPANQILGEKQEQPIIPSLTPTPTQFATPTPNEEDKRLLENTRKAIQDKLNADKKKEEIESQVNQLVTPTPQSYLYDEYYPILLSLSDNKGGLIKYSQYNQYPYSLQNTGIILKVGDTIKWKAEASDPKNRQIFYNFESNSSRFNQQYAFNTEGKYNFSSSNEIEYTISEEDFKSAGDTLRVVVHIKSEKENYRAGLNGYDDTTFLDYILGH